MDTPTQDLDPRFSDPDATPPSWDAVRGLLEDAELYWLTTVRADGRPHVTPLVGLWHGERFVLTTGPGEQKHRNLSANPDVAVTTGRNDWASGTDVVVEGRAGRVSGHDRLAPLAAAFRAKYGQAWDWHVTDDGARFRFGAAPSDGGDGQGEPEVFEVVPRKVLAFAKDPHGQTGYRF